MIFLQMVDGLRYYPVANAGAQPFRIPLFKRNWAAFRAYPHEARFPNRDAFKNGD
jgi:hypothetical protein